MRTTFKVHGVEERGVVDGKATVEIVTLCPIDPHENGEHQQSDESRSGYGQIKFRVDAKGALGRFKQGQLIPVTFEIPE